MFLGLNLYIYTIRKLFLEINFKFRSEENIVNNDLEQQFEKLLERFEEILWDNMLWDEAQS